MSSAVNRSNSLNKANKPNLLFAVPAELLLEILRHLPARDLLTLRYVGSGIRRFVEEHKVSLSRPIQVRERARLHAQLQALDFTGITLDKAIRRYFSVFGGSPLADADDYSDRRLVCTYAAHNPRLRLDEYEVSGMTYAVMDLSEWILDSSRDSETWPGFRSELVDTMEKYRDVLVPDVRRDSRARRDEFISAFRERHVPWLSKTVLSPVLLSVIRDPIEVSDYAQEEESELLQIDRTMVQQIGLPMPPRFIDWTRQFRFAYKLRLSYGYWIHNRVDSSMQRKEEVDALDLASFLEELEVRFF